MTMSNSSAGANFPEPLRLRVENRALFGTITACPV
jgi:hypothetical protein